jgi:hypothetical protein
MEQNEGESSFRTCLSSPQKNWAGFISRNSADYSTMKPFQVGDKVMGGGRREAGMQTVKQHSDSDKIFRNLRQIGFRFAMLST